MSSDAIRVLVVDDDEMTRTILGRLLEAEDYEVEICSSGSEALSRLLHCDYDVILCDMWMTGMSGKEFYLLLKQGFPEYQRRIVFITGDIASESTWEFIDERRLPYVIKPISRPLLRRKVEEVVGERPVRETPSIWDGVERRRSRRIPLQAPARVRRNRWEVAAPDMPTVMNASRGGIFFTTDREYRVGMKVLVAYPYTGYNDVEQGGYVVRVVDMPEGRRGVAIALGEEAVAARAAFAGSEEDMRRHHILNPGELTAAPSAGADPRLAADNDENIRRLEEEHSELKRIHDQVLDQRDRFAAQEAELKKKLDELAAAKAAASIQVDELHKQIEIRNEQLEQVAEVRHRATHDPLTGLLNRAAILDALREQLVRAEREGKAVGVLLGDLDHFKSVNDTFGHLAGDAVLREAAQRMSAAVRSYDAVGRYGGEEFLILLAGCEDDNDIMKQADRIRSLVAEGPVQTADGAIPITLSLGAASSSEYRETELILRAADAALYRAKRTGRNRVELALATPAESS
jgi:diguanylate cyclase (GGDEF)-like protein